MAATLTIASGVLVNDDVSTTSRFTSVTLTDVGAINSRAKQYPQGIQGMQGLKLPITFPITRPIRQKIKDDLRDLAVKRVVRGPRPTLSFFSDAVVAGDATAGNEELVQFTWSEPDRVSGTPESQSEWGYFTIVDPTIDQWQQSVSLVLFPVDRLRYTNSSTFLTQPSA